jgi:hypothetical protein
MWSSHSQMCVWAVLGMWLIVEGTTLPHTQLQVNLIMYKFK